MHCTAEPKEIPEISTCNIVQQTSFWANVKLEQGLEPCAFGYNASGDLISPNLSNNRFFHDDLLVLLQRVSQHDTIAYVPYGPKKAPDSENHGRFLEELSEVLRPLLPKNCLMIRYDLPWENLWAMEDDFFDDQGNWKGPPPISNQEFRVNFNTHHWNLHKSHSDNLPANTIFLDLQQREEEILMQMKPKTRYNIRLSQRKDVRIRNYNISHIDDWYALYKETARRNNVTLHDKEFFSTVLASASHNSNEVDIRLLMADHHGEFLAAMFLILSGKRGTYLYGATSGKKRNYMASYAIQWEAIKTARNNGCTEYDMFGTAPNANQAHPMAGLYRFKSGFGGQLYHRMGCWDYPLDENLYNNFRAKEVNHQSFHL
jgi:lipid II:glycine glycyltransferase (peptidoglycan interpeptide bridge formation enzyme)